ncbi:MAG TPA: hypothetical protein PKL97_10200, partial [Candidatus Omnitrophota bacterium]|nr:hypothetical protein [Candidatus Omnitrophota bacterium]
MADGESRLEDREKQAEGGASSLADPVVAAILKIAPDDPIFAGDNKGLMIPQEFLTRAAEMAREKEYTKLRGLVYSFFSQYDDRFKYRKAKELIERVGVRIEPVVREKKSFEEIRQYIRQHPKFSGPRWTVGTPSSDTFELRIQEFPEFLEHLSAKTSRGRTRYEAANGPAYKRLDDLSIVGGQIGDNAFNLSLDKNVLVDDEYFALLQEGEYRTLKFWANSGTADLGVMNSPTLQKPSLIDFTFEDGVIRLYVTQEFYDFLDNEWWQFPRAGYFEKNGAWIAFEIVPVVEERPVEDLSSTLAPSKSGVASQTEDNRPQTTDYRPEDEEQEPENTGANIEVEETSSAEGARPSLSLVPGEDVDYEEMLIRNFKNDSASTFREDDERIVIAVGDFRMRDMMIEYDKRTGFLRIFGVRRNFGAGSDSPFEEPRSFEAVEDEDLTFVFEAGQDGTRMRCRDWTRKGEWVEKIKDSRRNLLRDIFLYPLSNLILEFEPTVFEKLFGGLEPVEIQISDDDELYNANAYVVPQTVRRQALKEMRDELFSDGFGTIMSQPGAYLFSQQGNPTCGIIFDPVFSPDGKADLMIGNFLMAMNPNGSDVLFFRLNRGDDGRVESVMYKRLLEAEKNSPRGEAAEPVGEVKQEGDALVWVRYFPDEKRITAVLMDDFYDKVVAAGYDYPLTGTVFNDSAYRYEVIPEREARERAEFSDVWEGASLGDNREAYLVSRETQAKEREAGSVKREEQDGFGLRDVFHDSRTVEFSAFFGLRDTIHDSRDTVFASSLGSLDPRKDNPDLIGEERVLPGFSFYRFRPRPEDPPVYNYFILTFRTSGGRRVHQFEILANLLKGREQVIYAEAGSPEDLPAAVSAAPIRT